MSQRRNRTRRHGWLRRGSVLLIGLVLPSSARADGLVIDREALAPESLAGLEAEVARERAARPDRFEAVARTVTAALASRGASLDPQGQLAASLRRAGADALWPLLEAVALEGPALTGPSASQRGAVEAALLEAVGSLRDPRSRTVLVAAFRHAHSPRARHAAAVALGRLCDAAARDALVGWASPRSEPLPAGARRAAIEGLGHCRSAPSARRLAALLADALAPATPATRDEAQATASATALGLVGSSWAWRAIVRAETDPGAADARKTEAWAVRSVAARALLQAVAHGSQQTATVATRALAMVEHPETARWAAPLRGQLEPSRQAALDRLCERIGAARTATPPR